MATATQTGEFTGRLLVSNVKTFAALVLTWLIVAVIATTTAFIALRGSTLGQWLGIFGPMISYYAVWLLISIVIFRIVDTFHGSPARIAAGGALHIGFFLVVTLSLPFIVHTSDWRTWLYGDRAAGFHTLAAFIYTLNLVGALLIRFYRLSVARDREAREARLKSSLLENKLNLARMDALKMQINPHFLFNALNSIAALIETERNVEAYHATELLGGLLRNALEQSNERLISLGEELTFVQRYVDMEKVRFGSRIDFTVDADENTLRMEVPALVLQPLIENAIKHTVSRSSERVTIDFRAQHCDDTLELSLCDDGPGFDESDSGKGYGLANVRKRLELMYGDAVSLELTNRDGGGACATIRLPLQPAKPGSR